MKYIDRSVTQAFLFWHLFPKQDNICTEQMNSRQKRGNQIQSLSDIDRPGQRRLNDVMAHMILAKIIDQNIGNKK